MIKDNRGQEHKFLIEAKNYTTSKLTPGEVAELAGKVSEITRVAGVILITNNDLSKKSEMVATHKGFECWKMPFNDTDSGYFIVKKDLIETFDEETYDTPNRVTEESWIEITYSDGRVERRNM
ncbi:restriction endonuclease [Paenibacillus oralis]|uniref:restriction endonuclease n=1 Tax=Paenibacillus oralis TaxID=2490856 RepID=UPI0015AF6287|nr:restriction endonuclease [Paenibacillus oralis]